MMNQTLSEVTKPRVCLYDKVVVHVCNMYLCLYNVTFMAIFIVATVQQSGLVRVKRKVQPVMINKTLQAPLKLPP